MKSLVALTDKLFFERVTLALLVLTFGFVLPNAAGAQSTLNLSMTAPTTVMVYQPFDYTLTISNTGSASESQIIQFNDVLPSGVTMAGDTFGQAVDCSANGQIVNCETFITGFVVFLSPGQQLVFSYPAVADRSTLCQPFVHSASISYSIDSSTFISTASATTLATGCETLYTVNASAGDHGTITPAGTQTVLIGSTPSFTIRPDADYTPSVAGSCGGNLVNNVYTTDLVTSNCTVSANFYPNIYTITPISGPHGSVSPSQPVLVSSVSTVEFTAVPDPGYGVTLANSCSSSSIPYIAPTVQGVFALDVTGVTKNCALSATFVPIPVLTVSPQSVVYGQPVTLRAFLPSDAPSGTATFGTQLLSLLDSVPLVTYCSSIPWAQGTASCVAPNPLVLTKLPPGQRGFYVAADFGVAGQTISDTQSVAVAPAVTSLTWSSIDTSVVLGSPLQLAANLSVVAPGSGTPTGNITINDETDDLSCTYALSAVSQGCSLLPPTSGTKTLRASYAGDGDFMPAMTAIATATVVDGFVSLLPARILDTRAGGTTIDGQFVGGGSLTAAATLDLTILGRGGVPGTAVAAVVLNVTVTNPTEPGYITVWPSGDALPLASNLNFKLGETVPNLVIVKLGTNARVSLFNSSGSTDLIADVVGYFTNSADFTALAPRRLLDTRSGASTADALFAGIGALSGLAELDLNLAGRGGIPDSGAGAVVLNVTATDSTAAGYVSVWPSDSPRPLASNINFVPGQTVPNLVISKLSSKGQVSMFNSAGNTNLVADVFGWFPAASQLTALIPARLMDTRASAVTTDGQFAGTGAMTADEVRDLAVSGRGNVPISGVNAVVLNVTVTNPTKPGYLTVWPSGWSLPLASNLNFVPGQTVPNLVIAKVSSDGKVSLYNSDGSTDVVVDVMGWFSAAPK